LRVPLEELECQLPFHEAHDRTHGILRRDRSDQVDVIRLHVQLQHLDQLFLSEQLSELLVRLLPDLLSADAVAILWTKDDVIFTLVE
jgi:hypothetical protein